MKIKSNKYIKNNDISQQDKLKFLNI